MPVALHHLLLVLLLLPACEGGSNAGKEPQPQSPAALPDRAAGAPDGVKITVDGAPVAMQKAFIKPVAPDAFQVYLATRGGSCNELLTNVFHGGDKDKVDLLADLTPRLAADGTYALEVSEVFVGGPGRSTEPGSKATVGGSTDAGGKAEVEVDFVVARDGAKVEAHGRFTAEGCGADAHDRSGGVKVSPSSTATLIIAGKKLPVRGAIVKGPAVAPVLNAPKVRNIVLSTGAKDCSPLWPPAEVILVREGGRWRAQGSWLREPISVNALPDEGTKDLTVTPGKISASTEGPRTVDLVLAGAGTIGDYRFELAGTIQALDCGAE